MNEQKVRPVELLRVEKDKHENRSDLLAVEEPLEIRLGYGPEGAREQKSLSVTMRTPGNDFELVTGFLFTEGIIENYDNIEHIHYCFTNKKEEQQNIVRVELKTDVKLDWEKLQRHFYTSSSCGVCGKSSIESIETACPYINEKFRIDAKLIYTLPEKLSGFQPVFNFTGGLHAAALLDIEGNAIFVREDVGRHNAMDKVIGSSLIASETRGKIVVVSGRASFELVQKAAIASIPVMVAVGAPSSLAVSLAEEIGITLIGFTKTDRFNVYTGNDRINYEIKNKR